MPGVTEATVDQNYQSLIDDANNGMFDTVRYFFLRKMDDNLSTVSISPGRRHHAHA